MRIGRLIDLIGEEAAVALCEQLAGRRLYIARRFDRAEIAAAAGEDAAAALRQHCAGDRLDVPPSTRIARHAARRKAVDLLRRGISVSEVATATGISRRMVRYLAGTKDITPAAGEGDGHG